ncbi:MAG: O-antigen ligase family protein [Acidobacteria bacterium]|nr:O-antigen ligase family protein [Acidobacteriota bacterium]
MRFNTDLLTIDRASVWPALGIGTTLGLLIVLAGAGSTPWMILIGVVGLAIFAGALFSPTIAFLMVAAVVPLERIGRFTEDTAVHTISVMRIAGLLALASLLLHNFIRKRNFSFGAPFLLYAGYVACCMVSILYSREFEGSVSTAGMMLGNLLFLFLTINAVRSRGLVKAAVKIWLLATVLIGIYTMYDWHFGTAIQGESIGVSETRSSTAYQDYAEYAELDVMKRSMGPTSGPGVYGINLILTIPFFFYLLRGRNRTSVKIILWTGFGIVLYNIFLTNTRAALVGAMFALILCFLFKLVRFRLKGVVLTGFIVVALLPFVPGDVYTRMLTWSNYTVKHSRALAVRIEYWKAFTRVAQDHWLYGIGIGEKKTIAEAASGADVPDRTSVHNAFMATFLELGIIGWLFFMGFLLVVIITIRKTALLCRKALGDMESYWFLTACLVATFTAMIYGLQCDVFHLSLKGWWLAVGLSLAMAVMVRREIDRMSEAGPGAGAPAAEKG